MIKEMKLVLKMDREINKNKHYIMPGGYEVKTFDNKFVQFDFLESFGYVSDEDKTMIVFELSKLDTDSFPESKDLMIDNIKKFTEIFIHTGEYDEPEINVREICLVVLAESLNGLNKEYFREIRIHENRIKDINRNLKEERIVKSKRKELEKYLENDFLNTTDFIETQYPILKEFFDNKDVLLNYSVKNIVEGLQTENQELIGIYEESYYRQYLEEINNNIPFKNIPNGSFNHNDFGMYKSLDGNFLIEIQF